MRSVVLIFSLLLLLSSALAAEQRLNLFIWSEYLPPEVAQEFEKRFDCKLVIDLYEDAESMLAKVQGGGAGSYDIVVPPDYLVAAMVKQNLLSPLRLTNIANINNLDPKFRNPPYDPENQFTVAYQWGTVGIYARKKAGETLDESWSLLFDPKKQPGPIVLIDSMRDLIGAALKYRGQSLNSTDPAQLKAVRDLLVDAKKRSAGFAGSVAGKNKVLDKSARAAIIYSGEAGRGMAEDPETYYFIPREGSQIWVDNLVVLANAPHRDLAEKFVNFILEPEVGAKISNFTQFTTPNSEAKKLINPELLKNPAIYPSDETIKKLEFLKDLGRDTKLYDQVWTSAKSR
ncbi:MAG TPA: spermidine/putrescine ABC transporter substrate-binding protein [Verrucomicrobiae bacterium]